MLLTALEQTPPPAPNMGERSCQTCKLGIRALIASAFTGQYSRVRVGTLLREAEETSVFSPLKEMSTRVFHWRNKGARLHGADSTNGMKRSRQRGDFTAERSCKLGQMLFIATFVAVLLTLLLINQDKRGQTAKLDDAAQKSLLC